MIKILVSKFKRERKGAPIIEIVMILAISGFIFASVGPDLRVLIGNITNKMVDNISQGIGGSGSVSLITPPLTPPETSPAPPITVVDPLTVTLEMNPSTNIYENTPITFSASTTGGTGPYVYTWTNYVGNANGTAATTKMFPLGNNTVKVEATDSENVKTTIEKTFYVKPIPSNLTVSSITPTVGTTVTAQMAPAATGVTCSYTSPFNSSDCSITINITGVSPITVTGKTCFDGVCENHTKTINPIYPTLTASLIASQASPLGTSKNIQFQANVSGGSGEYTLMWTNYAGTTQVNLMGPTQKYLEGTQTITVKVCDKNETSTCVTTTIQITFVDDTPTLLITPLSKTIITGQSVTYMVIGSGGTAPYRINKVTKTSGPATAVILGAKVTFSASGIYYFAVEACDTANVCSIQNSRITVDDAVPTPEDPPTIPGDPGVETM